MPFGLWAGIDRRSRVRWGSSGAEGRCRCNQFWDTICYNWLLGYNFGCMIASDMLFDSKGGFSGSRYPMKTAEIKCLRVIAMATNLWTKIAIIWLCVNNSCLLYTSDAADE